MRSSHEITEAKPNIEAGQDLLLATITSSIENANKPCVPNEGWSIFLPISDDDILTVLRNLTLADLMATSHINRRAQWLVRQVLIERYRSQLQGSFLWQYLRTIADDVAEVNGRAFIDYFRTTTGIAITEENRPRYSTLSSCLNFARSLPRFPANWNGSKLNDLADLQALAKTILKDYPKDGSAAPRSLIEFINRCSPDYSPSQRLKLWNKYRIIDAQITTLLLFIRMVRVRSTPAQPVDEIGFLINPQRNCWLSGFGLIALTTVISDIFPRLVREAIWLFKRENKDAAQQERLKHIEGLLDRLTEADLLRYIPTEYYQRENPPNDPTAVYATYPYNIPYDVQRALLMEAIQEDYQFLMKKMTLAVLFKIERTNFRKEVPKGELTLNQSRILSSILQSRILLENLGNQGIVKLLFMLNSADEVIRDHPVLWIFLTFEVIDAWFLIDTDMRAYYAEFILSNAVILKSLTNTQIISIAQHLGPKQITTVLNSTAFQARLQDDKAEDNNQENRLLMQLAELPKNMTADSLYSFAPAIAEHTFTRALLSHSESRALIFDPRFGSRPATILNFLLDREDFIKTLSSSELLKAVKNCSDCSLKVAQCYLNHFTLDDLMAFSNSCISFIESFNKIELNVLFEKLPSELERRAAKLTSKQWLTFACMHSQLANLILERYLSKLGDAELNSLSDHYKKDSVLSEKIKVLKETRAQEKRQREAELRAQKHTAKRQLEEARVREIEQEHGQEIKRIEERREKREREEQTRRFAPSSQNNQIQKRNKDSQDTKSNSAIQPKTPWAQYLRLALFATLGLVGFALFMLGIGSLVGIPIVMTATSTLFSFLPWSAALTSVAGGYLVYLVAFVTAAVTSVDKTPEKTAIASKKSSCSTASFFNMFNCWSEASQNKLISQEDSLPELRFRTPSGSVNVRPQPRPQTTFEKDHDNSRPFIYQ